MRSTLSAALSRTRPPAATVARASAVALLTLVVVSCHSETTAPAIPKTLEFSVQPVNTDAVTAIGPIRVSALDGSGRVITSYTGPVTIALGVNPGAATLGGTKSVNSIAGVALFSNLTVNRPGTGYTLAVTSSGVTQNSAAFNIVPGPVASFVFSVQPGNTTAGATIAPAIQVQAMDGAGNLVTPFNGNVTIAIGTNPASGTLSGTASGAALAGIASFGSLSIDKAGAGYKLTATGGAGSGTSNAFDITAATATQLVFATQPSATAAGSNIAPAIVVTAQDQFGNNATSFANAITVAITGGTGKAGAALTGTKTIPASGGSATFLALSIDSVGAGYTLSATATGLVGGFASATFDIVPGAATQLVFTGQPTNATAGANIAPAITVTARDAKGNTATGFTGLVTLRFGTNLAGGTLGGTVAANAVAGVASFSTVNIDKSGTGYTLTAASGTLTVPTSNAFNIVAGAATKLAFTNQPTNSLAAATINSPSGVQVSAQDALGNTDLTFTGNVTVGFGTNAGGGTLSGTKTVTAAAGVAAFTTLSIDKVGAGYTLAATATSLTGATSGGFNVINSVATHLAFTSQPGNAVAGTAIAPAFTVTALDASNNVAADFTASIAVAILNNAGGGTLSGTASVTAVAGVASFATLRIDKTGDGYTLAATAGALTGATSSGFKITPAAATHLVFAQQPTSAIAGVSVAPAVLVAALDAFDNVDTAYKANVTMTIGNNAGTPIQGTLGGQLNVAAANGVATFSNLNIDKSGVGYTLHATSGTLTDATSAAFDISPAALSQLIFTSQPVATQAGAAIAPAVTVTGEDAFGNTVTTFTGDVTVAIGTNGGSPAGALTGTLTQPAASGVATFADLKIDKTGSGYTLITTAPVGPTPATSAAFGITAGAATQLAFGVQPSTTPAGATIAAPVVVLVQDALGNTVPGAIDNVVMAFGNNAGTPVQGTLGGQVNVAAANGVATFSNLNIDKAGVGYTLLASSGTLTSITSLPFDVTATAATKLVFTVPPVATTAGANIAPAVRVAAQDALGNTDPSFAGSVTVAIAGGTGKAGAKLSGAASVSVIAVSGVATFSTLSIDSAGTGYILTGTNVNLTAGVSGTFDITAGTATQLVFGVQPTNAVAGITIAPNVTVVAKDAVGNVDPSYTKPVTLTLPVNPGSATPAGATIAAQAGVATFTGLFLDKVGTGYKLQAGDGTLTSAQSNAFNVTFGAATQLAFIQGPSQVTVGANIFPAVKVAAQDAFGNTVTTFANNITMSLATDPTAGTAVLSGPPGLTKAAVSGVATFTNLNVNTAANGYQLGAAATASGLTAATSNAFNVISSAATTLFFKIQPSSATAGTVIAPDFTVEARDASGQLDVNYAGDVTISITPNTGAPGATITAGTVTHTASAGTATFTGIEIDKAASNYKLTAAGTLGVSDAVSGFFAIRPAAANKLVYTVQPSNATALATIAPQVEVSALDAFDNVATGFTDNVTIAISDANASGGVLSATSGLLTRAAVAGLVTFGDLSIDKPQTSHNLTATDAGGAGAGSIASNPFDITVSTANHLVFGTPPGAAVAGQAIPTFTVEARDAANALLAGPVNVTVSITGGTGTNGATLSGTATTVATSGGIATFTGLTIDKKGTGYKLSATAAGLAGATSGTFAVSAGAASQVAFIVDPANAASGAAIAPAIQVDVEDALGNRVTNFAGTVSLSISVNPGGDTLSGTKTQPVSNGIATFGDIAINAAGSGYRLLASSTGLSSDVSQGFSITAGGADHLVFTVSPNDAVAGVVIAPDVKVTALDAQGNVATTFIGNVTVTLTPATGTPGAALSGGVPQTATAALGVATFNGLSVDKAGSGYTLSATASGPTGTTSGTFTITAAAATKLGFITAPANTAANATIAPPVQVAAQDQFGNTVTTFSGTVSMTIGTNAGGTGTVLSGTTGAVPFVNGVATFADLSINNPGTGYTLSSTSSPVLSAATSPTFNIL